MSKEEKARVIHYNLPEAKVKMAELEIASLKWGIYDGRVITKEQIAEADKIMISLGYKELQAESKLRESYHSVGLMNDWSVKIPDWSGEQNFTTRLFRIKESREAKVLAVLRSLYPTEYNRVQMANYSFVAYLGLIYLEKVVGQSGGKFKILTEKVG